MKKSITLFMMVFMVTMGFAQITINSSDVVAIGATATQASDTTMRSSSIIGATGSQTWDFSDLETHTQTSIEFIASAGTPYEASFPDANLAAVQDGSFYVYMLKDAEKLAILGTAGEVDLGIDTLDLNLTFDPADILIQFPATNGNSYSFSTRNKIQLSGGDLGFPTFDSVRLVSYTNSSVNIDAFGSVTTPLGTYDCIRLSQQNISFDTTDAKAFGMWINVDASDVGDTTYSYAWWTNQNGLGFPIANLEVAGGAVVGATWLSEFTTSSREVFKSISMDVYPNPAAERINIATEESYDGIINIIDFNGKRVASQAYSGIFDTVELNGFLNGQYLLTLQDKTGKLLGFKTFQIAR
ncbi:MAG: T9SS type A sorting domain-containing protein [Saprospiraceae bacterium]